MSRYHVTRTALQFVADHADAFAADIGAQGVAWFTYMRFCCTSDNKTVVFSRFFWPHVWTFGPLEVS